MAIHFDRSAQIKTLRIWVKGNNSSSWFMMETIWGLFWKHRHWYNSQRWYNCFSRSVNFFAGETQAKQATTITFLPFSKISNRFVVSPHIFSFFFFFLVRSCFSICLIAKFHHFINKTGIISPWIYSQKLRHLRYINLVWMKQWHLIKILFFAWKSSAQNRKNHAIVVICSLYHDISHTNYLFCVACILQ